MRISWATSALLLLCIAAPARSEGIDSAERKLEAALSCYGRLELDCFGARLQEALALARKQRAKPPLEGRILLYIGVHHAVINHLTKAAEAFELALRRDPLLDLDPQQFKPALVKLFRRVRAQLKGTLAVTADTKGATVYLDGERIGVTPLQTPLAIGRHEVRVKGPASTHSEQVLIGVGGTIRVQVVRAAPAPSSQRSGASLRRPRIWTWVAAGGAAVTLAVAIGLGVSANTDHAAWEEELERGLAGTGDRQKWEALGQDVERKATAANVLFVTGGVLAVAAAVLFFVEGREAEIRPSAVTTTLGPGPGGPLGLSLTRWF